MSMSASDPKRTLYQQGKIMDKTQGVAALACVAALLMAGCTHHSDDPAVQRVIQRGSGEVLFHFDPLPAARIDDAFVVHRDGFQTLLCGHATGSMKGITAHRTPFIFSEASGSLIAGVQSSDIEMARKVWKSSCDVDPVVEGRRGDFGT